MIKKPKLTKLEKKALIEFKQELLRRFPNRIKKVILYGSRARGESEPESDIDVLIIADSDDWQFAEQVGDISYDIQFKYNFQFYLSEMLYSEKAFKEHKSHLFVRNVTRDGVEI